jgi:hypothetical protein
LLKIGTYQENILKGDGDAKPVMTAAGELEEKLAAFEAKILKPILAEGESILGPQIEDLCSAPMA